LKSVLRNTSKSLFLVHDLAKKDSEGIGILVLFENTIKTPFNKTLCFFKASQRFRFQDRSREKEQDFAFIECLNDEFSLPKKISPRLRSFLQELRRVIKKYIRYAHYLPENLKTKLSRWHDLRSVVFSLGPQFNIDILSKYKLLQEYSFEDLLVLLIKTLKQELMGFEIVDELEDIVKVEIDEQKRRYLLNERLRTIKSELGEGDLYTEEIEQLERQLNKLDLPAKHKTFVLKEFRKLQLMTPGGAEFTIGFQYLSLICELPWKKPDFSEEKLNLKKIEKKLDRNHFGLKDIKDRILDYIAVIKYRGLSHGKNLLITGPPGVGKSSIAMSIADSLGLSFARIALGGLKDEAEIRGHRRTYIGAMPGKIVQAIQKMGDKTGIILLDEIDKISPTHLASSVSATLLDVLDKAQNKHFQDHYLSIDLDLSHILFIATANDFDGIDYPLLDRFEEITLSAYSPEEKYEIVRRHLLPKIRRELSLSLPMFNLRKEVINFLIEFYTCEAGVRQLNNLLIRLAQKVLRYSSSLTASTAFKFHKERLLSWLGPQKYLPDSKKGLNDVPGVVTGLAYTQVGGDTLTIEARYYSLKSGSCHLKLTGCLGDVMKESAEIALSSLMSHAKEWEVDLDVIQNQMIHIHFPDGATPKDGPSAGVAVFIALYSLFSKRPLLRGVAMTGELTLRGQILPVGGVREKVLAAHRQHYRHIVLPKENKNDLLKIPEDVLKTCHIQLVDHIRELKKTLF